MDNQTTHPFPSDQFEPVVKLDYPERERLYQAIKNNIPRDMILQEFNITQRVYYYHRAVALGKLPMSRCPNVTRQFRQILKRQAIAERLKGKTLREIADQVGVSLVTVSNWVKEHIRKEIEHRNNPEPEVKPKVNWGAIPVNRRHLPLADEQERVVRPPSKERLMAGR